MAAGLALAFAGATLGFDGRAASSSARRRAASAFRSRAASATAALSSLGFWRRRVIGQRGEGEGGREEREELLCLSLQRPILDLLFGLLAFELLSSFLQLLLPSSPSSPINRVRCGT